MSAVSGSVAVTRASVDRVLWLEQVCLPDEYMRANRHVGQIVLAIGGD
jgi:hypothetical protein